MSDTTFLVDVVQTRAVHNQYHVIALIYDFIDIAGLTFFVLHAHIITRIMEKKNHMSTWATLIGESNIYGTIKPQENNNKYRS